MSVGLPERISTFWTFLSLYVGSVFLAATSRSFFYSSVQSIEREFGFRSEDIGLFGTGNKISYILFSIPVAYLSSRFNRARWIGIGLTAICIGSGMFALPHLIYKPDPAAYALQQHNGTDKASQEGYCNPSFNSIVQQRTSEKCEADDASGESGSNQVAFWIFFWGNILCGIGYTFNWNIATPLIDDNVSKKNAPLYFGGIRFLIILGPFCGLFIGAAMLNLHYTLTKPSSLEPSDPTWIGAYWLAYAIVFVVMITPVILLACFPDTLERRARNRRFSSMEEKNDPLASQTLLPTKKAANENSVIFEIMRFLKSVLAMFRSPIYTIHLVTGLMGGFAFRGWFTFLTKFLNNYYDISQADASMIMGLTDVISYAVGNVIGSFLTKKLRLEGRRAAGFILVGFAAYWGLYWVVLGLKCTSTISRIGAVSMSKGYELTEACNAHCNCEGQSLKPVCAPDGTPFYNPCVAGCSDFDQESKNYTGCGCVPGGWVSKANCFDDCYMPALIYCVILGVSGFIQGLISTPQILFLLRSVPDDTRALGLALQGFLKSILSTLPSPIVYGLVIDGTCRVWNYKCGNRGSCAIYDTDALLFKLHVMLNGFLGLAGIGQVFLWYFAKDFRLLTDDREERRLAEKRRRKEEEENSDASVSLSPEAREASERTATLTLERNISTPNAVAL